MLAAWARCGGAAGGWYVQLEEKHRAVSQDVNIGNFFNALLRSVCKNPKKYVISPLSQQSYQFH